MVRHRGGDIAAARSATMHAAREPSSPALFLMQFERIAWSVTILIGLVAALLFFHNGFRGYGLLAVLLSLAASVNLAPTKTAAGD